MIIVISLQIEQVFIVGQRKEINVKDFERDTVIGKNYKGTILTLVDRICQNRHHSRKSLGWYTPSEVMASFLTVALAN